MNKRTVKIGFIPLTDSLPLLIAQEQGFFKDKGLEIELVQDVSWANIRDKMTVGSIDCAHMLAPMFFASALGVTGIKTDMVTAFSFGLNGNAITLSSSLMQELELTNAAQRGQPVNEALAEYLAKREAQGLSKLTLATVFPYSCHYYQLYDWLKAGGVDIPRQVKFCVLPPQQMVDNLERNNIHGYCVGEPWNTLAVQKGIGRIAITGYELWRDSPEKVLAANRLWHKYYSDEHALIIQALMEACDWLEENPMESADLLSNYLHNEYPVETIYESLSNGLKSGFNDKHIGSNNFYTYNRKHATMPSQEHATLLLQKLVKHSKNSLNINISQIAETLYLTDFYQAAISQ